MSESWYLQCDALSSAVENGVPTGQADWQPVAAGFAVGLQEVVSFETQPLQRSCSALVAGGGTEWFLEGAERHHPLHCLLHPHGYKTHLKTETMTGYKFISPLHT